VRVRRGAGQVEAGQVEPRTHSQGKRRRDAQKATDFRGQAFVSGPAQARFFGLLAAGGAGLTVALLLVELIASPAPRLPGIALVTAACGATLVTAAILLREHGPARTLDVAGAALMLLGVAAGGLLPDGLDAAAIMPLAGAVLTIPSHRGRPLVIAFVLAFTASMVGETAALTVGADRSGGLSVPQSLVVSGVMLALAYTLIWWVGDRWWTATSRAQHALAGQRRLLEVNERLLSTLDPEGVLNLIADTLKSVVAYDNLSIYRVDRKARVFRPVLARDRFANLIMSATFPLNVGVTGWVVAHGEAQCVNDTAADPRAANIPGTPSDPEALIVVPLFVKGEVAGTLNMGRMGRKEAHFSSDEFDLARLFAGQVSIALQNAETHRAVWDLAETDALTTLRNRGAFDERLKALEARRAAQPFALIMVDLDGFKAYNDRHGHQAGDSVLQAVGQAISSAVRDRDLAFRYGGDEFAILIPNSDPEISILVAERVGRAIAEVEPMPGVHLTASSGIAIFPIDAQAGAGLVAAADTALYRAKDSGGDRAVACCDEDREVAATAAAEARTVVEAAARDAAPGRTGSRPATGARGKPRR
jgi:diguanylate cyclase (GGDEF)-like protein